MALRSSGPRPAFVVARLLCLALAMLWPAHAAAQTGTITGTVARLSGPGQRGQRSPTAGRAVESRVQGDRIHGDAQVAGAIRVAGDRYQLPGAGRFGTGTLEPGAGEYRRRHNRRVQRRSARNLLRARARREQPGRRRGVERGEGGRAVALASTSRPDV